MAVDTGGARQFQSALRMLQKESVFPVCDIQPIAAALNENVGFVLHQKTKKLENFKKTRQSQAKIDMFSSR